MDAQFELQKVPRHRGNLVWRTKQFLIATGVRDVAKKVLKFIWSKNQWLLYSHNLEGIDNDCPGDLSFNEILGTNIDLVNELAQLRKIGRIRYNEQLFAKNLLHSLHTGTRCFVARSGNEIVGWVRLAPLDQKFLRVGVPLRCGCRRGQDLFVTEKYRGTGFIAYFLLIGVLRAAKTSGASACLVDVNPTNVASIRMTLRVGFTALGKYVEKRCFFYRTITFQENTHP